MPTSKVHPALSLVLVVATLSGCGSKSKVATIYQYQAGDYAIECDGEQKQITVGGGRVLVMRVPEDIRIAQGRLQVGPREYGEVAARDKISVVGVKVAVNGVERKPVTP